MKIQIKPSRGQSAFFYFTFLFGLLFPIFGTISILMICDSVGGKAENYGFICLMAGYTSAVILGLCSLSGVRKFFDKTTFVVVVCIIGVNGLLALGLISMVALGQMMRGLTIC